MEMLEDLQRDVPFDRNFKMTLFRQTPCMRSARQWEHHYAQLYKVFTAPPNTEHSGLHYL